MSSYVVLGACAYLTTISPLDGKPYRTLLYQGALVPDSATEEEIAHNLEVGLIGPADILAGQDEVVLLHEPGQDPEDEDDDPAGDPEGDPDGSQDGNGDGDAVVLEEPARNGSKDEWAAYAVAKGAALEDVVALKRDELVELYGTPAQ
jgi:hypothetical protein